MSSTLGAQPPSFAFDHGRIRLADVVFVYVERALAPAEPLPAGVPPRSHGLAPTAVSPSGSVVASVGRGEAVWLGFQAVDPAQPAIVRVRLDRPEPIDAVTGGPWEEALADESRNYLVCPPDYCLPGVQQRVGHEPFGLGVRSGRPETVEELSVLSCGDTTAVVPIRLVNPATFSRLTGLSPQLLDPESAYKGWRLP